MNGDGFNRDVLKRPTMRDEEGRQERIIRIFVGPSSIRSELFSELEMPLEMQ